MKSKKKKKDVAASFFSRRSRRGGASLLIAFYFPQSRAGVTHQNVPPPGREQLRDPAAKPPLEYQSICKAIFFYQHRGFSKAALTPGECIIAASRASAEATPGRASSLLFRFTPGGKILPCNSDKKKKIKNLSTQRHREMMMIIKIHFAPIFEVRR